MTTPITPVEDTNKRDFQEQYTVVEQDLTDIINGTSTKSNAQIIVFYAQILRFIWIAIKGFFSRAK